MCERRRALCVRWLDTPSPSRVHTILPFCTVCTPIGAGTWGYAQFSHPAHTRVNTVLTVIPALPVPLCASLSRSHHTPGLYPPKPLFLYTRERHPGGYIPLLYTRERHPGGYSSLSTPVRGTLVGIILLSTPVRGTLVGIIFLFHPVRGTRWA